MEAARKKTKNEESEASEVSLPEDVISPILSNLPVKTLLRFRCVARSWSSTIISPYFVKTHLNVSLNNREQTHHRVLAIPRSKSVLEMLNNLEELKILEEYTLLSLFRKDLFQRDASINLSDRLVSDGLLNVLPSHEIQIFGSVNGLIGLYFRGFGCFLWNPTTRKFNALAYPKNPVVNPKRPFLLSRSGPYGFGYDRFQDDYKIVAEFGNKDHGNLELKMYSLNNGSWKTIVAYDAPLLRRPGKFVNGKLHWPGAVTKNWGVVSFDLSTEQWGVVEQPTCIEDHEKYKNGALHLGVLKNSLAIFHDSCYTHVDVWMLKEYGVRESWTKLCVVRYPDGPLNVPRPFSLPSFFLSHQDEILVIIDSKPMIYNVRENSLRPARVIGFNCDSKMQIYVESLVSPLPREDAVIP